MKRSIPFFAALFALSLVLSASAAAQASKCGDRDYTCKIAAYTAQIADNKDDIEAYYNRGIAFQALGKHDEAILDFTKYIGMKPSNLDYLADGYSNRGISYKRLNKLDLAIAEAAAEAKTINQT